jgi:hypothetical protein
MVPGLKRVVVYADAGSLHTLAYKDLTSIQLDGVIEQVFVSYWLLRFGASQ